MQARPPPGVAPPPAPVVVAPVRARLQTQTATNDATLDPDTPLAAAIGGSRVTARGAAPATLRNGDIETLQRIHVSEGLTVPYYEVFIVDENNNALNDSASVDIAAAFHSLHLAQPGDAVPLARGGRERMGVLIQEVPLRMPSLG